MTYARTIAAAALLVALVACQASSDAVSTSAMPLSADAIVERMSGNTEVWKSGGGYYGEDGTLLVTSNGKNFEGTWQMKGNSLCMNVSAWGKEECHDYVDDNGVVKLVYEGRASEQKLLPGNQLGSL